MTAWFSTPRLCLRCSTFRRDYPKFLLPTSRRVDERSYSSPCRRRTESLLLGYQTTAPSLHIRGRVWIRERADRAWQIYHHSCGQVHTLTRLLPRRNSKSKANLLKIHSTVSW